MRYIRCECVAIVLPKFNLAVCFVIAKSVNLISSPNFPTIKLLYTTLLDMRP